MYLRETRRTNKDGTVVRHLQLAHNERHPVTGAPTAKVIHNFGRAGPGGPGRAGSAGVLHPRVLGPEQQVVNSAQAAGAGEVEVLESRRMGGARIPDRVWERLGIGTAIRRAAKGRKLIPTWWSGCSSRWWRNGLLSRPRSSPPPGGWPSGSGSSNLPALSDDQAYRGMDSLDAAEEIAAEVFNTVATLLNLDLDLVFVDTTSTYFETDRPDELPETAAAATDDEESNLTESGARAFGHSKDFRTDLFPKWSSRWP